MSIFGNSVIGNRFFTREKELDFLHRKVEDLKKGYRHNAAILGRRMIGKSSLLLHFLSTLDRSNLVPIYLDLSMLSFDSFIDQFIGMLLYYNYKDSKKEIISDNLQSLTETASSDLPKTYKKIKTIHSYIKADKKESAFLELLDLPSCFSSESGKFCLIVFDNFRKLANYGITKPFSILGEKIMLQKMSLYILSDYPNADSRDILSEKLSLLFGKFQVIELKPFDLYKSTAFIDSRIKDIKLPIEYKKFLVHLTGGEPFYLDVLTETIVAKSKEERLLEISEIDFYYIISEFIFSQNSLIYQHFTRLLESSCEPGHYNEAIKVLNAVIRKNKITDIIEDSKCTKKQGYKLLERFMYEDIIVKNGPLYTIKDEIFKIYIKLQGIKAAPRFSLDQGITIDNIANEIKQIFDAFRKEQQKSFENKITNLIAAFDNEKVTVGRGTHILPTFKHIHCDYISSEDFILNGHGTKLWVFSIFKKPADEDDILDFINYCKAQKHKVGKKVLILLSGITSEAKLLAMEERIWIWPLDKLNNLFDLYGKPKIAV